MVIAFARGDNMKYVHSPMLNQTINPNESDAQNSVRFLTERPSPNEFLFYKREGVNNG